MSDFTFADPRWVHALWGVLAFCGLLVVLDRRGVHALDGFLSRTMQARLIARPPASRRLLAIALLGLSGALAVVALMRPQWGFEYIESPRAGTELMICLDVSKSMLAEDVAPNRLERAKAEILDLLPLLEGDHVGLIGFAGKATVLCPLTPDFGYLRLVLEDAGPGSVSLGGTDLAAPLKKAVHAFGESSDISRAILLVTDGEDHDEYAVDAAKEAAEKGIQIISIGFGDEGASEIPITDPKTGARTLLRDADGEVVRTHLDGEKLRAIAAETAGAYIPAGTGILDLESIYHQRIAPLTRGRLQGRGRTIPKEGFQWALLPAILALVGSVWVGHRGARAPRALPAQPSRRAAALLLVGLCLGGAPGVVRAQGTPDDANGAIPGTPSTGPSDSEVDAGSGAPEGDAGETPAAETAAKPALPEDPRVCFNDGLAQLAAGELDGAEELFTAARRRAKGDAEVRFRATFDLAMVWVRRAEAQEEEKPEEALAALENAASWFREAVRLREDSEDARHNLEVVLKRALALRDALHERGGKELEARLDELIQRQREFLTAAQGLVERVAALTDPNALDAMRAEFRALAKVERRIISDCAVWLRDAAQERDIIEGKEESQRTPEERLRAAQIELASRHLHDANQRLGQARRQLRLRQAEPCYRRGSRGLTGLKRARDQFRDPVQLISELLRDGQELAGNTLRTARAALAIDTGPRAGLPGWLTPRLLIESQADISERTEELRTRLEAALAAGAATPAAEEPTPGAAPPGSPDPAAQKERALAQIREATPFVVTATEAFAVAGEKLEASAYREAAEEERRAVEALTEALERFADLKRLIEIAYTTERQIEAASAADEVPLPGSDEKIAFALLGPELLSEQRKNIQRLERLQSLLVEARDEAVAEAAAQAPPPGSAPAGSTGAGSGGKGNHGTAGGGPDGQGESPADPAEQQRQRFALAGSLRTAAEAAMGRVVEHLEGAGSADATPPSPADGSAPPASATPDRPGAHASAAEAVEHLAQLRRLFFSIVEHLKETARRQAELGDDTQEVAGLAAAEPEAVAEKSAPLVPRQTELAAISGEIARVLDEQAKQPPPQVPPGTGASGGGAGSPDAAAAEEARQRLARAAELVQGAKEEMEHAARDLGRESPELDGARTSQQSALDNLVQAIALLEPPRQQPQDQQRQQQDQQQQQQQQQQDQQQANPQQLDVQEMLQQIRDREAERRKQKSKRAAGGDRPVEKDW